MNLMGILHERRPGDFERVHGEFVRRLVLECRGKVRLFAQVSALGAAPAADSAYLRSKAQGERIVRDAGAMRHVIVRPSVVFGRGDSFATMFAGLARFFPVMLLPCADAKFQPVAVEDLARMICNGDGGRNPAESHLVGGGSGGVHFAGDGGKNFKGGGNVASADSAGQQRFARFRGGCGGGSFRQHNNARQLAGDADPLGVPAQRRRRQRRGDDSGLGKLNPRWKRV